MVPSSSSSLGSRTSRKKTFSFSISSFNSSADRFFSFGSEDLVWAASAAAPASDVNSSVRRFMRLVYEISIRQFFLPGLGQPETRGESDRVYQQRNGCRGIRQFGGGSAARHHIGELRCQQGRRGPDHAAANI